MKLNDILDGVELSISRQWPEATVYRGVQPKDLRRPSFLLKGGPVTVTELGGSQEKNTVQVRLTCFSAVDELGNGTAEELLETMESLLELFRGGYLRTGGRALRVIEVTGDHGPDYAEVTAKLEFYEVSGARRGSSGIETLMENIHTNIDKE